MNRRDFLRAAPYAVLALVISPPLNAEPESAARGGPEWRTDISDFDEDGYTMRWMRPSEFDPIWFYVR